MDVREMARKLRDSQTDAERLMWYLLRNRNLLGYKFRRQHPVPPYVVDFYCEEFRVAVELDGGQHNEAAEAQRDSRRTAFLATHGVRVLRFWNDDVLIRTEEVLESLLSALLGEPSPAASRRPLPGGEGKEP